MHRISAFAILLIFSGLASADRFDELFRVVFIDEHTESKIGPVPLQRRWIAQAVEKLADAGATAVILKFFLDRQTELVDDNLLAESFSRLPVVLQARIDHREAGSRSLESRFFFPDTAETTLHGETGWIPVPRFSANAVDIGFTDFDGFPVSLFATFQGKTVKSLLLASLEMAMGESAVLDDAKMLQFKKRSYHLDRFNRVHVRLESGRKIPYVPFHDILEDKNLPAVNGKIVILGYNGPNIHSVETNQGAIPAHILFVKILRQLVNSPDSEKGDE